MAAGGGVWKGGSFYSANNPMTKGVKALAQIEKIKRKVLGSQSVDWRTLKPGDVVTNGRGQVYRVAQKPTKTGVTVELMLAPRIRGGRASIRVNDSINKYDGGLFRI